MTFSHPLARQAKVWAQTALNGKTQDTLVVVTTLDLDPQSKLFKKNKVQSLTDAVKEHLKLNPQQANGFLLINRPKEWAGDKRD